MKNTVAPSGILNDCYHFFFFLSNTESPGPIQLQNNTFHILLDEDSFTSFPFIFSISPLDIVIWVTLGNDEPREIRGKSIERHPRLGCVLTFLLSLLEVRKGFFSFSSTDDLH